MRNIYENVDCAYDSLKAMSNRKKKDFFFLVRFLKGYMVGFYFDLGLRNVKKMEKKDDPECEENNKVKINEKEKMSC